MTAQSLAATVICGLLNRDGAAVAASDVSALGVGNAADAGPTAAPRADGEAALWPALRGGPSTTTPVLFAARGRIDGRDDLIAALGSPSDTDAELMRAAYLRWGEGCCARLLGDWAFAAWHPAEHRLFLARDRYGLTALFYHVDARRFVFSSSWRGLLALPGVRAGIDELYVAQVMAVAVGNHGERTAHRGIRRLPPAHCLTASRDRFDVRCYWRMEDDIRPQRGSLEQLAGGLRHALEQAVRDRLRPAADGRNSVAATLSSGLDSGSVTVTAAEILRTQGRHLPAYIAVPLSDTRAYVADRSGDELPLAEATARHAGNVTVHPVPGATITPVGAIRRALEISGEPEHAAGNLFWILDLLDRAARDGAAVLLTGQDGNAGLSWAGDWRSQPLAAQWRALGWRNWLKLQVASSAFRPALRAWRKHRFDRQAWLRATALRPEFAARLTMPDRLWDDPNGQPSRTPLERRLSWLMPGRSAIGSFWAMLSDASGVEVRDPTGDVRLLTFALGIPDRMHRDPQTGLDRCLVREAMRDRLPDEVRLNRRRGRQGGDLVPRLRASAPEVETALNEVEHGAAADCLDCGRLREAWTIVRTQDSPTAHLEASMVLTRGLMAGLFVNRFHR